MLPFVEGGCRHRDATIVRLGLVNSDVCIGVGSHLRQVGHYQYLVVRREFGEELGETLTLVMQGQDAYEGLTAYVVMDLPGRTFNAAIIPGGMPEFPEPPAE